jgi:hypothetical protein
MSERRGLICPKCGLPAFEWRYGHVKCVNDHLSPLHGLCRNSRRTDGRCEHKGVGDDLCRGPQYACPGWETP